jgi:chromosome segregation ATPase
VAVHARNEARLAAEAADQALAGAQLLAQDHLASVERAERTVRAIKDERDVVRADLGTATDKIQELRAEIKGLVKEHLSAMEERDQERSAADDRQVQLDLKLGAQGIELAELQGARSTAVAALETGRLSLAQARVESESMKERHQVELASLQARLSKTEVEAQAQFASREAQDTQIVELQGALSDAHSKVGVAENKIDAAKQVGLEADRRRSEMAEAVESSRFWADKEVQKLKQVVVTLKRTLDKERAARKAAELAAEDERKRATQARLAAEPRIAAWRAAQEDADPETELEIED